MSESQSRYSIVERLTERKLMLIREKAEIDKRLSEKKAEVEEAKQELKDLEVSFAKTLELEKINRNKLLRQVESQLKNAEEEKKQKTESIEEQITALNEALTKIEEVSKTAGSNS
jgi:hypothetical protein